MDSKITQEILDDLIPSLKALDTQSAAVLEFLKHEGIASDEKLAPYLAQAASASNVRWLGVRVRIERLLSFLERDSTEKRTVEVEEGPEAGQAKAPEASQSQPAAADSSKSDGPEIPTENIEEKDESTNREHIESESNFEASGSTRKHKNHDRLETTESNSKPANGAEQKVA